MADRTVWDLLEERNFVTDAQEDQETERGLAATHPEIADDYREARRTRAADIVARSSRGSGLGEGSDEETMEELRQTIREYRLVYERLVER